MDTLLFMMDEFTRGSELFTLGGVVVCLIGLWFLYQKYIRWWSPITGVIAVWMLIAVGLGGYMHSKHVDNVPYADCRNMSVSDVQDWFVKHEGGIWAEHKSAFAKLDGKKLCAMTEEQFLRAVPGIIGSAIYNDWRLATTPLIRRELNSIEFEIWVGLGILLVVPIGFVFWSYAKRWVAEQMRLSLERRDKVTSLPQFIQKSQVLPHKGSTSFAEHWKSSITKEVAFDYYFQVAQLPLVDDSTMNECEAFNTEIDKRQGNVDGEVRLLEGNNVPEKYFQEYCFTELSKIELQDEFNMADTCMRGYLDDNRKPDLSLVYATVHSLNVIVLGEVKTMSNFDGGAKGELLTFLRRVRIHQPTRKRFYGFLTNGIHVLFMMLDVVSESVIFTPPLSLKPSGDGRRGLISLLMATAEQLDFLPVNCSSEYTVEKFLGSGATSYVYLVKDLKAKAERVFKMVERASAEAEVEVLHKLSQSAQGEVSKYIPSVVSILPTGMVISPVAQQFENPSIEHFCQLVDTVRMMHENKVFHRDIRPANWMKSRHGSLLIDFGYAIIAGGTDDQLCYSGTISFASIRVLNYLTKSRSQTQSDFRFDASDDLVSIVRVCYYYVTQGVKPSTEGTTLERIENSKMFWENVIKSQDPIKKLNELALAKNYDLLKKQLENVVFLRN